MDLDQPWISLTINTITIDHQYTLSGDTVEYVEYSERILTIRKTYEEVAGMTHVGTLEGALASA